MIRKEGCIIHFGFHTGCNSPDFCTPGCHGVLCTGILVTGATILYWKGLPGGIGKTGPHCHANHFPAFITANAKDQNYRNGVQRPCLFDEQAFSGPWSRC